VDERMKSSASVLVAISGIIIASLAVKTVYRWLYGRAYFQAFEQKSRVTH
jgi:hypothetical protein